MKGNIKEAMSTPNAMFGYYLMSSYAYYRLATSIFLDEDFDGLCKSLFLRWEEVTHKDKGCAAKWDLECGTGYAIRYPYWVHGVVVELLRSIEDEPKRKAK